METTETAAADHAKQTPARRPELLGEVIFRVMGERPHPLDKRADGPNRKYAFDILQKQLGARYGQATFENYRVYNEKQTAVIEKLRDFAENLPARIRDGGGLILYGAPGTGKDHLLAALMLHAVCFHGLRVSFRDGMALFAEARKAIHENNEDELRDRLCEPHILALSDPLPPTGMLTDYQAAFVRDVIDKRYRNRMTTWVTTNIDRKDDLVNQLSLPVYERLIENSMAIFCDWESFRTRKV